MASSNVTCAHDAASVRALLDLPKIRQLVTDLDELHLTDRFARKLREHGDVLAECIDAVPAKLRNAKPEMGRTVAIDGSDLPAYGNGQKYIRRGGPERKK